MITLFQAKSFWRYWLEAVESHSLHSPFLFDFYTKVVTADVVSDHFTIAERLRDKLLNNPTPVFVDDYGSGQGRGSQRTIADIARTSLSSPRFSRLYHRIIGYYECVNIVELGTSLGVNTVYLAMGAQRRVATFEGAPAIASVARSTFEFARANNIRLIEGNLSNTLPLYLEEAPRPDFVFMDANHRYDPTLHYWNLILKKVHPRSIVVVDDIHYTAEMQSAWQEMRSHPLVYGSADLYRAGILFFDPSLNKQHVVLQFQALK